MSKATTKAKNEAMAARMKENHVKRGPKWIQVMPGVPVLVDDRSLPPSVEQRIRKAIPAGK